MDQNCEFLQDLYQNTKMGEKTLGAIVGHVDDEGMKSSLTKQMQGYSNLNNKAKEQLYHHQQEPKSVGPITKAMSQTMSRMNAIRDGSATHIAEMVIQGSTMGIVNTTEDLNKYSCAAKEVMNLANEVVHFEQENIDRMKQFL